MLAFIDHGQWASGMRSAASAGLLRLFWTESVDRGAAAPSPSIPLASEEDVEADLQ